MFIHSSMPEARNLRVTVDGTDVSSRCFAADDQAGYADCFKLDEEGHKYVVEDGHGGMVAATEKLVGLVVVTRT